MWNIFISLVIFFRTHCEMEQTLNSYMKNCGCKPYYLPGNLPWCNATGMECVKDPIGKQTANPKCKHLKILSNSTIFNENI